ncbi:hypothetical protein [Methylobacterium haplocladii]|uniref:Uncharacterized protein n=1 Tax=Methylobacterium haplocladii TaxID=1176176 RepID=A0A512IJ06_9HYPH|nr:hypothetical protein [Methylobacterium haplocladii]GEO97686.1 hypothetical protein MHA02_00740 [Methylobacterium haplocladii]GJD84439.1 hypothetical protein HPGCJGGD_2316 [Methylobacterium haplocladii]GLS57416.1 hypothetical protein GCM10007887_00710 [Methylobacterium haplocladii]
MIDIIQQVRGSNPALPTTIIVLRADSRALADPENLTPEAQAWVDEKTPGARLSRESVLLAPYPGAMPTERKVTVLAFSDARHLAAFATAWTADPIPEGEE